MMVQLIELISNLKQLKNFRYYLIGNFSLEKT